ncbi:MULTISPECIES: siderophore ABC transporter substrate-binding protein [Vibrio]|uniref:Siderophore ABC transporter substrate-binding protein n=1 Tax=Vibrio ostreae TaxID=2841925 RepID=A0A975YLW5_9VIBR|nr:MULTISPECIES: siderophore ABC transporter substrate-binding protein [Vibrio]QXO16039.1 siderophore ABC transporter substrate-binding protein [Vibrio ostreae]WGY44805.1 siderophore ABC transporter substrate-binding protein [Vibrio sp. ABG19]
MKSVISLTSLALVLSFSAHSAEVTIEHQMGKTTLEQKPQRVVVIGLGALDAVDSFGIKPVAVSKVPQLPPYLDKYHGDDYAQAGSLFEPDFESIYTQKPDLIIVGSRAATAYDELSKIAPTIVFAVDDSKGYWESTQEQWHNLGKVFDIEPQVDAKIDQLKKEIKQVHDYTDHHTVDALTVMSSGGNLTTFGKDSRFSAIYRDFGFKENTKVKQTGKHGDLISYEFIREHNPQTLFIIDRDKLVNKGVSHTHEEFENDLVKATDAYQNKRMKFLDLNAWYISAAGVKATEQMVADMKNSVGL